MPHCSLGKQRPNSSYLRTVESLSSPCCGEGFSKRKRQVGAAEGCSVDGWTKEYVDTETVSRRYMMVLGLIAVPHSGTQLLDEGTSQERGTLRAVAQPEQEVGLSTSMPTKPFFAVYQLCPFYVIVD